MVHGTFDILFEWGQKYQGTHQKNQEKFWEIKRKLAQYLIRRKWRETLTKSSHLAQENVGPYLLGEVKIARTQHNRAQLAENGKKSVDS